MSRTLRRPFDFAAMLSAVLILAFGVGCRADDVKKVRLVVWGVWRTEGWRRVFREFERRHPNVELVTSTTGGRMDEQKLMCGIAGGAPPDVINQDRFSVGGWAARDAFLPLDKFIARDRNRPDGVRPENFYPACWQEAVYKGKVYAIPNTTDDRVLFYNEDLLRKYGFVNEDGSARPPRTWDELKRYAVTMTETDAQGRIRQIGFVPNYGNSWLYLYGWQNGGRFMSADGKRCTLDDPRIVEALEWITSVYDALGGVEKVDAFSSTFQSGELDPFLSGRVAMKIDCNGVLNHIAQYKPNMHFGVAPAPVPKGRPYITWSGGFSWAIPRGARHVEMAWEFIRWVSSVEAGVMLAEADYHYARSWGRLYVPGISANRLVNEIVFRRFAPQHPRLRKAFRFCLDMMRVSRFRPVTPVGQLLWDEHVRAMDLAIHHARTPQQALKEGAAKVQRQLDLLHHRLTYPPLDWRYPIALAVLLVIGLIAVWVIGWYRSGVASSPLMRRETLWGYLLASPWMVGFFIFTAGPIIASIVLSFCQYDALHPVRYVALDNYRTILRLHVKTLGQLLPWRWEFQAGDPLFWKSLWNTIYMVAGVPLGMAVGLGIAMLLNARVRGLAFYRTVYYLPAIVPVVASSILWIWVLNPEFGLINSLIKKWFGIDGPMWLQSERWSKPSIILMGLWGAGASMIIWLAGLKGIPEVLYEAAEIDGANWWDKFRHVTIPMLSPYIFFNLVMGIIGTFQIFTQAYIMTSGGPVDSTLFYVYYLFNNAFRYFKMGYASALAWILFIIILLLTLVQLRLAPRWVYYEAEQ